MSDCLQQNHNSQHTIRLSQWNTKHCLANTCCVEPGRECVCRVPYAQPPDPPSIIAAKLTGNYGILHTVHPAVHEVDFCCAGRLVLLDIHENESTATIALAVHQG